VEACEIACCADDQEEEEEMIEETSIAKKGKLWTSILLGRTIDFTLST
jgi:hypothetical protein